MFSLVLAWALTGPAAFVELSESTGALSRDPHGNRWTAARLDFEVANQGTFAVRDLQIEVALVEDGRAQIPGWKFRLAFEEEIPAQSSGRLSREQTLLPQGQRVELAAVRYQARLLNYRPDTQDLGTVQALLASDSLADQRAAFSALRNPPPALRKHCDRLLERGTITGPEEALTMLMALKSIGPSAPTSSGLLLALPSRVNRKAWAQAFRTLAETMVEQSEADAPRLQILPPWARQPQALNAVRIENALRAAVIETAIRIGDAGVPEWVRISREGDPHTGGLAASILHAIGRPTVATQLATGDRQIQIAVMSALGVSREPADIHALAAKAQDPDPVVQIAAVSALEAIGPRTIPALLDALAVADQNNKRLLKATMTRLAKAGEKELRAAARRFGIQGTERLETDALNRAVLAHLDAVADAHWAAELEAALERAARSDFDQAFRRLDRVYAANRGLYDGARKRIANAYLARGYDLEASGNYDAAVRVLRVGQSVVELEEAASALDRNYLALARGHLDLGALEEAERFLRAVDTPQNDAAAAALWAEIYGKRAELAYAQGDHTAAANLVDRAKTHDGNRTTVLAIERKLGMRRTAPLAIVMAVAIPALLVALLGFFRNRAHRRKLAVEDPT